MFVRLYTRFRHFLRHHWLTFAFILGFVVDTVTLNRVDELFDNIVLFTYVCLAMVSIIVLYAAIAERFSERANIFLRAKAPLVMQYAFGGLLSGMLIFYGRSSSLAGSWVFILIIIAVIVGNETIRNRSSRLLYNLIIFFTGLFAYVVLIVPVFLGRMGPVVFVFSGLLALVLMWFLVALLSRVVPRFMDMQKRMLVFCVGLMYVGMNILYFANIIPPIPLSLKDIGIFLEVKREETGSYLLTYEKPVWYAQWYRRSNDVVSITSSRDVYCYASIFAPARLNTKIFHTWEYYDEGVGWVAHARIPYVITGGRGDGYRGYTAVTIDRAGSWRCTVETERGQVIGQDAFTVAQGIDGELVTRTD